MLPMSVEIIACRGIAFSSSRSIWRGCINFESLATSSENGSVSWSAASSCSQAPFSASILAALHPVAAQASSRPSSLAISARCGARASR